MLPHYSLGLIVSTCAASGTMTISCGGRGECHSILGRMHQVQVPALPALHTRNYLELQGNNFITVHLSRKGVKSSWIERIVSVLSLAPFLHRQAFPPTGMYSEHRKVPHLQLRCLPFSEDASHSLLQGKPQNSVPHSTYPTHPFLSFYLPNSIAWAQRTRHSDAPPKSSSRRKVHPALGVDPTPPHRFALRPFPGWRGPLGPLS